MAISHLAMMLLESRHTFDGAAYRIAMATDPEGWGGRMYPGVTFQVSRMRRLMWEFAPQPLAWILPPPRRFPFPLPPYVSAEFLPNGLFRLHDRASGLTAVHDVDGAYRHGNLRIRL